MFHDLLNMDLSTFNVRAVPHTAAKAHQQAHSLRGIEAWVYHILQEGAIGNNSWRNDGLTVGKGRPTGNIWISVRSNAIGDQMSNRCGQKRCASCSASAFRRQGRNIPGLQNLGSCL